MELIFAVIFFVALVAAWCVMPAGKTAHHSAGVVDSSSLRSSQQRA